MLYGFGFVVFGLVFGIVLAQWWQLGLVVGPLVLAAAIIAKFSDADVLANVLFGYSFVVFSAFLALRRIAAAESVISCTTRNGCYDISRHTAD